MDPAWVLQQRDSYSSCWRGRRQQSQTHINKWLRLLTKQNILNNQLHFLHRCKKHGLIPHGLRIRIPKNVLQSEYGKNFSQKGNWSMLRNTISDIYYKLKLLQNDILILKDFISTKYYLGETWMKNTTIWLTKIAQWKSRESKLRLHSKYKYLVVEKQTQLRAQNEEKNRIAIAKFKCDRTIIYNDSGIELSNDESELLSLGLNFCIAPKKFPLVEHITAIEQLCEIIDERDQSDRSQTIRNIAMKHLRRGTQMKIRSNITNSEKRAIKSLQTKSENRNIMVVKADKGRACKLENEQSYIQKEADQISKGDYKKERKAEKTILDNIRKKLKAELVKMGYKTLKEQKRFLVSSPYIAKAYLLCKVHKVEPVYHPARMIVSQINDPTYLMSKILTDILNPLDETADSFIKSSVHLKEHLKILSIDPDCFLSTCDATNLFPSIPVKQTLGITFDLLKKDKTLNERTKWTPKQIVNLMEICLETYFKSYDGTIYTQTDGTPIGKSISGPMAGIYLRWFEYTFIRNSEFNSQILLWKRMRDDVLIVWKKCVSFDLQDLKTYLNSIEERVQWTMDLEERRQLPFTDILISRKDDKLITKVYRKATHTNKYINWRSCNAKEVLIGTMKTLIFRAYKLCDLPEDLNEELLFLKDTFIANDFPPKVVDRVFASYKPDQKEENEQFDYTLTVPFIPGFSENLKRELRKLGVRVAFRKGRTLESILCRLKFREPFEKSKNNIYKRNCKNCNFTYIGETSQYQQCRDRGHKDAIKACDANNSFYDHLKRNPTHEINWDDVSYLDKDNNTGRRLIKEALYINAFDEGNLMNLKNPKPINPIWNEFRTFIRKNTKL